MRSKSITRCLIFCLAIFAIVGFSVTSVLAHTNPPGSNSTGITASITLFRANAVGEPPALVPVLPGSLTECETIYVQATLSWAGTPNAAFEGGTWTITMPNGSPFDVTPAAGIPCIGGTTNDPNSAQNGGRGICLGAPTSLTSELVQYTVSSGDIDGLGNVLFRTDLVNAYAHLGT